MARTVELKFKYTGTDAEIKALTSALKGTGAAAKSTSADIAVLESVLKAAGAAGEPLNKTLAGLAKNPGTPGVQALTGALRDHVKQLLAVDAQGKKTIDTMGKFEQIFARIGGRMGGMATGLPGGGFVGAQAVGGLGLTGGTALGVGAGLVGLFAAIEGIRKVLDMTKWAQDQKNLASEIGVTVTEMESLTRISEQTGVKLDGVAKASGELGQKLLEGGARARDIQRALTDLGLSSGVAFEGPVQAMNDVAAALAKIPDNAKRSELAVKLLGDQGRALAGVAEDLQKKRDLHLIDEKTINELADAREKIKEMGESWDVLLSKAAKPLTFTLNFLSNIGNAFPDFSGGRSVTAPDYQIGADVASAARDSGKNRRTGAFPNVPLTMDQLMAAPKESEASRRIRFSPFGYASPGFDDLMPFRSSTAQAGDRGDWALKLNKSLLPQRKDLNEELAAQQGTLRDAEERYGKTGSPLDKKAALDAADAIKKLNAEIEGLKDKGESARDVIAKLYAKSEPNELQKALAENAEYVQRAQERFPREAKAIGVAGQYRATEITREDAQKFQQSLQKLDDELTNFENSQREKGESRGEREANDLLKTAVKNFEDVVKLDKIQFQSREKAIVEAARGQNLQFQIGTATENSVTARKRIGGQFSEQSLAGLDLSDQLAAISGQRDIQTTQLRGQAALYRKQAGSPLSSDDERAKLLADATEAEAKAKDAETEATLKTVEAQNKYQESLAQTAANNLKVYKDMTGQVFDAIVSKNPNTALRTFGLDLVKQQGKIVFENLFTPITAGIGNSLTKVGGATGLQNGPLKGTMFDPDKSSVLDKNTSALDMLRLAMIDLKGTIDGTKTTGVISGQGVIGSVSNLNETIGTLDKNLGGSGGTGTSAGAGGSTNLVGGGSDFSTPIGAVVSLARSVGGPAVGSTTQAGGSVLGSLLRVFGVGGGSSSVGGGSSSGSSGEQIGSIDRNIAGGDGGYNEQIGSLDTSVATYNGSGYSPDANSFSYPALGVGPSSGPMSEAPNGSLSFPALGIGPVDTTPNASTSNAAATLNAGAKSAGSGPGGANDLSMGLQAAGGAFGIFNGVKTAMKGGAGNLLGGTGQGAMGAASILAMIPGADVAAPFVAAGGALLSLIGSIIPNPKAIRQQNINNELVGARYNAPEGVSIMENADNGNAAISNYRGGIETLNAIPTISYYNKATGINPTNGKDQLLTYQQALVGYSAVPGFTPPPVQQVGGAAYGSAPGVVAQSSAQPITVHVSTMDSKSFADHSNDIANAMVKAFQSGHRVRGDIQKFTSPQ